MITALVLLGCVVVFGVFAAVAIWAMCPPEYREPGSFGRLLGAAANLGADVIDQAAVAIAVHQANHRATVHDAAGIRERAS